MTVGSNINQTGKQNKNSGLKVLRNFGYLTAGKLFGDAFTFFLFATLSRTFGQEGIGQYSIAMALTGIFAATADFGLSHYSIKEMSRRPDSIAEYYGSILALRIILSILALGMLVALFPVLSFSFETKLIILIIGVYQLLYTLLDGFFSVFIAKEEMHWPACLEFSLRIGIALAALIVVFTGGSLLLVLITYPALTFCQFLLTYLLVNKKYGRVKIRFSWTKHFETLRKATPNALSGILFILSARVDVIFLGLFLGEASAGIYNVAYRIIFFSMVIANFGALAIYPMASKLYLTSRKELEGLYNKSLNMLTIIGLPSGFLIWLIAPSLISLVFGRAFVESSTILRILALMVFLSSFESMLGIFLMSCDREFERTKGYWVAAWVNIAGNILLIPSFGLKGAAVATLTSKVIHVFYYLLKIHPLLGFPKVGSRFLISGLGSVSFFLPFLIFSSNSLFSILLISTLIYIGILVSFEDIRKNEFCTIFDWVKTRWNVCL